MLHIFHPEADTAKKALHVCCPEPPMPSKNMPEKAQVKGVVMRTRGLLE